MKSFYDSTGPVGIHLPPHTSSLPHLVLTPVGGRNHGYPGKVGGTEVADMSIPLSPAYRGISVGGMEGISPSGQKRNFNFK